MARLAFPSRLELKSPEGSFIEPFEERQLHDVLVGLACAYESVARPHRDAPPPPFFDDRGIGVLDQRADPGQCLAAPVAELLFILVLSSAMVTRHSFAVQSFRGLVEYILDENKPHFPIVLGVGDFFGISAETEVNVETRELAHNPVIPIRQRYSVKFRGTQRHIEQVACANGELSHKKCPW